MNNSMFYYRLRSSSHFVIQDIHVILSSFVKKLRFLMTTFQDFYNGLQWEPNGSRSKRQFQCKGL